MWGHPDQEEGPRAFAEKREPNWQPLDAESGHVTEVGIGTAIVAYIEPHAGRGAGVQSLVRARPHVRGDHGGSGCVLGRPLGRDPRVQGVATAAVRTGSAIRRAGRSSPRSGCSTARNPSGTTWVTRQMAELRTQADRMFAGRDHLHTAVVSIPGRASRARAVFPRRPRSIIRIEVWSCSRSRAGGGAEVDRRRSVATRSPSSRSSRRELLLLGDAEPPRARAAPGLHAGRPDRRVAGPRRPGARLACPRWASGARSYVRSPAPTPTSTSYDHEPEDLHPRADRRHRAQPRPLHASHDGQLVPGRPGRARTNAASVCGRPSVRPARGRRS